MSTSASRNDVVTRWREDVNITGTSERVVLGLQRQVYKSCCEAAGSRRSAQISDSLANLFKIKTMNYYYSFIKHTLCCAFLKMWEFNWSEIVWKGTRGMGRERRRDVACSVKGKRLREPPWVLICPLSPDGREEIALPLLDATIWINIFWYYYRHIKIFYICGLIVSEYVLLFRDAFTICRIDCGCHEEQMIGGYYYFYYCCYYYYYYYYYY